MELEGPTRFHLESGPAPGRDEHQPVDGWKEGMELHQWMAKWKHGWLEGFCPVAGRGLWACTLNSHGTRLVSCSPRPSRRFESTTALSISHATIFGPALRYRYPGRHEKVGALASQPGWTPSEPSVGLGRSKHSLLPAHLAPISPGTWWRKVLVLSFRMQCICCLAADQLGAPCLAALGLYPALAAGAAGPSPSWCSPADGFQHGPAGPVGTVLGHPSWPILCRPCGSWRCAQAKGCCTRTIPG